MRLLCLLLFMLITACGGPNKITPRSDDALIRLGDAEARGLDPQIISDLASARIAADQFEGLTRFDDMGEVVAGMAESWTVNPGGNQWTFTLRPSLKFSDGTSIDASVFPKALARIRDKNSGSPQAPLFSVIQKIDVAAGKVIVYLNNPFPQLPALLAQPAMAALPFHRIEAKGEAWTADRPLVTSGPYRLTDWKLNQQMTLQANPHWYDGKPATASLIWRPVDNKQTAMRQILSGAADIATDFPSNRLAWLKEHYPQLVRESDSLATYYFAFNMRRPPFDDARVRRALSAAIDREWIAEKMIAAGNAPAWGLLPAALRPGGAPSNYATFNSDTQPKTRAETLKQSRLLLAAAGYGPSHKLRFEIRFNSSAEHRRAAVALATMWREIGVEASLLNSEASLHFDAMRRGEFEMARSGWIADLPAPENFLAIYRSDAGAQNYSGYANPVYDAALDSAMAEADPARRAQKMANAEKILIADMPILPLYFYTSKSLVGGNINGWKDNIANTHPSHYLAKLRR
jgi:oligopeptide transport system substrate-binding protein